MLDQRGKYIAGQDALMALIMADKPEEAKTYLSGEMRPVLAGYKGATSALIEFQVAAINATARSRSPQSSSGTSVSWSAIPK